MRIFNWVNRKFHNKDHAWDLEGAYKKAEHVEHTLIAQDDGLGDVIDSWKQGILTIGTFGYDPLKDFTQLKHVQLIDNNEQVEKEDDDADDDDDDDDVDDEQSSYVESFDDEEEFDHEHNPLLLHAFKHAFNTSSNGRSHCDQDINYNNVQEPEIMVLNTDEHSGSLAFDDNKKGKRVTLADLFSADFEEYNVGTKQNHRDHGKDQVEDIKKQDEEKHAKAKLSFAKKLIPRVKEDSNSHSRPIKKIHRMMTKMLKKKIHPELEGKNQKGNQMKHSENGGIEMVSLLQTQGHVTDSSA